MNLTNDDVRVSHLGKGQTMSPLPLSTVVGDGVGNFTPDEARVRHHITENNGEDGDPDICFEKAGARKHLFFVPGQTTAAIVTCGGLCPGINNVVRSLFRQLYIYGVREVYGIQHGFRGLIPKYGLPPITLTHDIVEDIHKVGGTILSSSRGHQDVATSVDFLQSHNIQILFCIGGDGTQRGAHAIAAEIAERKAPISVIGIPKTIDNDILYVSRTFGFNTAIEEARKVLDCAHVEAKGAPNGIGLVKLMGRESGFIATAATLASQEVNFCLVPEIPFNLDGPSGFLALLKKRLFRKSHAVIAVAEGAGQHLFDEKDAQIDASGNVVFQDIGIYLKGIIKDYFDKNGMEVTVKYFDPSYIIRSVPANSDDSLLCDRLARNAVHAAMAGKTDMLIGLLNDYFIHVPIALATRDRKVVDPESDLWISVHETTGQPLRFDS